MDLLSPEAKLQDRYQGPVDRCRSIDPPQSVHVFEAKEPKRQVVEDKKVKPNNRVGSRTMQYSTYSDLPALAGLCHMERAIHAKWSVEESVDRQKRLHYVLKRLAETFTARITNEPIYELKMVFSHHAYLCSEHVTMIRQRVAEMREPPLGLDRCPHDGLAI